MSISIYDYREYRDYLADLIKEKAQGKRGIRGEMAQAIGCQNSFISQVLAKQSHFNLEHAEKINPFLGHTEEESHFFLLMVQLTRAGTRSLADYFSRQMQQVIQQRLNMKERFQIKAEITSEDQSIYYSAWYYGAIRVLISIPTFQTKEAIAKRLHLPISIVTEVLEFLVSRNLARIEGDRYLVSVTRMHLGKDSALIAKHHTNWRMRAIASLDYRIREDLHYSSVISISNEDFHRLKTRMVDFIEEVRKVTKESPEEELFTFNLDFFRT